MLDGNGDFGYLDQDYGYANVHSGFEKGKRRLGAVKRSTALTSPADAYNAGQRHLVQDNIRKGHTTTPESSWYMAGSPAVPTSLKTNIIRSHAHDDLPCIIQQPDEANNKAEFTYAFAKKCMWLATCRTLSTVFTSAIQGISPGIDHNLANALGRISASMVTDGVVVAVGGALTNDKDVNLQQVLVSTALKGFCSPVVLSMFLPGGQFGLVVFAVFLIGRTLIDMSLDDKYKGKDIFSKECLSLLALNAIDFLTLGVLDSVIYPMAATLAPALVSSALGNVAFTAACLTAKEQFIMKPMAGHLNSEVHQSLPSSHRDVPAPKSCHKDDITARSDTHFDGHADNVTRNKTRQEVSHAYQGTPQ